MTEEYYWDIYNATTGGKYLDQQEKSIVTDFLDTYTPKSCLDCACGSGRFTLSLMEKKIHVVAADFDRVPLKKLNGKLGEAQNKDKLECIMQINAESLPFKDHKFDSILSIQTVGNLNIQRFFSECNRVLEVKGWLLFNEANHHSYKAMIHRKLSSCTQFYRHSHSDICSLLRENNFKVQKAIGMNWLPIKRDSNSQWTPFASKIEKKLRLGAFPSISPWVFYVAQKIGDLPEYSISNIDGDEQW